MTEGKPMTQKMNVTDARQNWDETLSAVAKREKWVVLEQAGKPVAALISVQDLKRLQRYDAEWEADFAIIDRMRAAFADIPDDELERAVKQANEEARAELRAERAQAAAKV